MAREVGRSMTEAYDDTLSLALLLAALGDARPGAPVAAPPPGPERGAAQDPAVAFFFPASAV
jgi:hypothetical protein